MSFVTRSPDPFGRGPAFPEAPFYCQCIHRSPSCCFPRSSLVSTPAEVWAFQIPSHHAQVMAPFLQSGPASLLPSVRFLCAVNLGQEFSVHPCWPSAGPARLATHQRDPSRALRTLRLKTDQLCWTPLPSRATPMGYCLPESLNKPKPSFLKSRAVVLHMPHSWLSGPRAYTAALSAALPLCQRAVRASCSTTEDWSGAQRNNKAGASSGLTTKEPRCRMASPGQDEGQRQRVTCSPAAPQQVRSDEADPRSARKPNQWLWVKVQTVQVQGQP